MKQGPHPKNLISVQCPNGHDMYPNGIVAKTLWNNNGVRFNDRQEIVPSEWKRDVAYWKQEGVEWGAKRPVDGHPPLYKYGCYRFTEEQYKWVGTECKECAKQEIKEKDY